MDYSTREMVPGPLPPERGSVGARDVRTTLSDTVNEATADFLRHYRLRVAVGTGFTDLGWTWRRFQLVMLEPAMVAALRSNNVSTDNRRAWDAPLELDLTALWQKKTDPDEEGDHASKDAQVPPWRAFLRRRSELGRSLLNRIVARLQRRRFLAGQRSGEPIRGIKKLYFVDAGEIHFTRLGTKPYVYHKYLEGILDFDRMTIPEDTLVVWYGPIEHLDRKRRDHPRVTFLESHVEPGCRPLPGLVAQSMWNAYFHSQSRQGLLGTLNESEGRRIFGKLLGEDLRFVTGATRLLERLEGELEIVLDSFDSTMFSVGQFLLRNYPQHGVVALQKVLGPYTFSFNMRNQRAIFEQPSRLLAWSRFHADRLRSHGLTCPIETSCAFKLRTYATWLGQLDHEDIRRRLGIPAGARVIMFSAVAEVIGFPLFDRFTYYDMLDQIAQVATATNSFVLFKPWPGEDTTVLEAFIHAHFKSSTYRLLPGSAQAFHNAELLSVTDVLVSTMSSLIGEAFFFGALPVLVNSPSTEAYFSSDYTSEFRRLCAVWERGSSLVEIVRGLLVMTEEQRVSWRTRALGMFGFLFGEVQ